MTCGLGKNGGGSQNRSTRLPAITRLRAATTRELYAGSRVHLAAVAVPLCSACRPLPSPDGAPVPPAQPIRPAPGDFAPAVPLSPSSPPDAHAAPDRRAVGRLAPPA